MVADERSIPGSYRTTGNFLALSGFVFEIGSAAAGKGGAGAEVGGMFRTEVKSAIGPEDGGGEEGGEDRRDA